MAGNDREWALGAGPEGAAALQLVFDSRHLLSPLHAEASCHQVCEALCAALPQPPRVLCQLDSGDGLLLTATDTQALVHAALQLQAKQSQGFAQRQLAFRCGIHAVADAGQPQAEELRLLRQVAATAEFGSVCLSAQAVDQLDRSWQLTVHEQVSGDSEAQAGGDPLLRCFRVEEQAGPNPPLREPDAGLGLVLAVLPPDLGGSTPKLLGMSDLVADFLILTLSRASQLRLVSARSSRGLRHSRHALDDGFQLLQAHHVLQCKGSVGLGDQLFLELSLHAQAGGRRVWHERLECRLEDLLYGDATALQQACADIHRLLLHANLAVSKTAAWETLEHYQVFSAATQLMHRLSPGALEQSGAMLSWLVAQEAHATEPRAWLAFWHLLRGVQGQEPMNEAMAHMASFAESTLARDAQHALAHTLLGHALAMQDGQLDRALQAHQSALQSNPSCALAWSFQALALSYADRTREACESARLGLALSPLDPWQYFMEAALAHALLAHQHDEPALLHAQASLRLSASHAPSWLYLTVALQRLGRRDEAAVALLRLRQLWPAFTVSSFQNRYWGRQAPHAQAFAQALAQAGLPLQ